MVMHEKTWRNSELLANLERQKEHTRELLVMLKAREKTIGRLVDEKAALEAEIERLRND